MNPTVIILFYKNKKDRSEDLSFLFAFNQIARSTLLERRHLVHAYTWQGVPLTTALTRFTLGFQVRLDRLWEWETLIPKVTPLPQKSHLAIHCTSYPHAFLSVALFTQSLKYCNRLCRKMQALFSKFFTFFQKG